ncbi:MAG: stage III sporulation protein AG [Lachnospiraceae bacterium]|nr:stage III sporulation protein AG [Lachnospiraceae bacterium]
MILSGILLFVISLPVKDTSSSNHNSKQSQSVTDSPGMSSLVDQSNGDGGIGRDGDETSQNTESTAVSYDTTKAEQYTLALEQRLEKLLSSMEGVGNVKVMITLQATAEQVVEKDQPNNHSVTTETDGAGSNRNVNDTTREETTVYITDGSGNQIPYVVKELEPVVEGVTVVAQGGGNPVINKNITDIIQALFGIEAHKIMVVKMKS